MRWTEQEYSMLLDAMESGGSVQGIIDMAANTTGRSKSSVERKLKKMGYLRSCSRPYSNRQGYVR